MKLGAKLSKLGFDQKFLVETLDFKSKGIIKFSKLIQELRDRFQLLLSQEE